MLGNHFLLLKILYAISKYHSPAVAISAGLWYNTTKESAVWQTVSTFPASQSQRMTARVGSWGGHFLLLKILYAMSNMPKPTVASSVSRAKVSKSVIEHHPFRCGASGAQQKCSPSRRRAGKVQTACRM